MTEAWEPSFGAAVETRVVWELATGGSRRPKPSTGETVGSGGSDSVANVCLHAWGILETRGSRGQYWVDWVSKASYWRDPCRIYKLPTDNRPSTWAARDGSRAKLSVLPVLVWVVLSLLICVASHVNMYMCVVEVYLCVCAHLPRICAQLRLAAGWT